jgi:hypothetical protein
MNECLHRWYCDRHEGDTAVWKCCHCDEVEVKISEKKLQGFVTQQYQIEKLFEGVKPYTEED